MVGLVAFKLQPIHFAAFTAASLVVLSGCLSMDEAYRAVSWRVVALIAALLPVGIALERTGAARLMAEWVIATAGPLGPVALIAGFGIFSNILSQALDGTVAVVLVAPIALQTAEQIGIAPAPLLMSTALSASMAFLTPVSHRANLLVMGAGGYSNREYFKLGGVITMVTFAVMYSLIPLIY